MLSLSAELTDSDVNLQMINGDDSATAGDIQHGTALLKFAEAFAGRDEEKLEAARSVLLEEAGPEVLVDTAGVAANFQRMVRIADATGIPLDERNLALSHSVRKELKLERFATSQNSPPGGLKRMVMSWIARPMAKSILRKMAK